MYKNTLVSYSRNVIEFWYNYQVYNLKCLQFLPVAEGELYKVWVCDRLFSGIAGSNPAGGMDVFLYFSVVCCQVDVSATGWSLVQRSPTDCGASLCVI